MANDSATSERRKTDIKVLIKDLEASFKKDPTATISQLAEAYLQDGRPKDAIRILEKSGNGKIENQVLLAQALFDSFQNAKAAEAIQEASNKGDLGNNLRAQILLGELAVENNKIDQAKDHFRVAMKIDSKAHRPAELLRSLGEDVQVPELGEDPNEVVGFRTEDESQLNTPAKAIGQVILAAAVLGAALAGYIWKANLDHTAKTLAVEAIPLVAMGDIESLREAESKYNEILEISSSNAHAIAGQAYLQALLWIDHGVDGAKEKALDFTEQATADDIQLGDRYAAEVLVAYGSEDFSLAEKIVEEVATKGGVSEKLNWGLGLTLEKTGKVKLARENYRKAHDLKSKVPHYAVSLGDNYDAENDKFNAALYWAKAQASNSTYVPAAARELLVRIRKGNPKPKIEEDLKRLQNMSAELLGNLDKAAIFETAAALAYREGDGPATVKNAQQGLQLAPDDSRLTLLEALGMLHGAEGEKAAETKKTALTKIKSLYTKNPQGTRYLHAVIDSHLDHGFYDEGIEFVKTLKEPLLKSAAIQTKLGNAHRLKKDFANAKVAFDAALKARKDFPDALLGQAISFWNQRKYDDARSWFEKAVNAKTKFAEVYENIGLMFLEQGAPRDANTQLEEADRQYRAQGKGKRELSSFYNKVITAFEARRQSTIARAWKKRLADLETPAPTGTKTPETKK